MIRNLGTCWSARYALRAIHLERTNIAWVERIEVANRQIIFDFDEIVRTPYRPETLATPHSKKRALNRDVINPQGGHILCASKRRTHIVEVIDFIQDGLN